MAVRTRCRRFRVAGVMAVAALALGTWATPVRGQISVDMAVHILAEGRVDDGRRALVEAAMALPPGEATPILRMAQTLGAVSSAVRATVARSIVLAHRDSADAAVSVLEAVVEAADAAEPGQGAALLLLAGRLADEAGDVERAESIYVGVVADHRESQAWPEAVLTLSERRLEGKRELRQAANDLEDLIVDHPTHALVPAARLMLGRLEREIGR